MKCTKCLNVELKDSQKIAQYGLCDECYNEVNKPRWIEKHSINCFECERLVDERDCLPNPKGEGAFCPECAKQKGHD